MNFIFFFYMYAVIASFGEFILEGEYIWIFFITLLIMELYLTNRKHDIILQACTVPYHTLL